MKCLFGHKWEVITHHLGVAEYSFLGVVKREDTVRAVISKCKRCGKKKGELIDSDGDIHQKDVAILEYQMDKAKKEKVAI